MSGGAKVIADAGTVTVIVPLRYRKRGGRKVVIGEVRLARYHDPRPVQDATHQTILKALGRAYRWKRMLESGEFASISDLAKAEKINHAYVRRILRLTLLSPKVTEAIINGFPKSLQFENLLKASSEVWVAQTNLFL